jgi:hypothetical protein
VAWHIRGSYFEACNCDAICPCRRVNGVPGGRSTHGVCVGVLSWLIEEGEADGVDLTGMPVGIAFEYSDDVQGSPWDWILYLDATATAEQNAALEAIFTGRAGGDALEHFPWAWKPANLIEVRRVGLEVHHEPRRQRFRIHDHVTVRIRDRYPGDETVTCVVPGHDRGGEELITDVMRVNDGPLVFEYSGVCGYASTFDYSG